MTNPATEVRDMARAALGKSRAQLNGPRTPKPSARKKRRLEVRASRKTNR